jgi:hypothetical protein
VREAVRGRPGEVVLVVDAHVGVLPLRDAVDDPAGLRLDPLGDVLGRDELREHDRVEVRLETQVVAEVVHRRLLAAREHVLPETPVVAVLPPERVVEQVPGLDVHIAQHLFQQVERPL